MIKYLLAFHKKILIYLMLLHLTLLLFPHGSIDAETIGDEKVDWERYYSLTKANKLPLLSDNEEEEILNKVNEILREKKSLLLAMEYIISRLGTGDSIYLGYGNQRIKDKLVELFKIRVQCKLKKEISDNFIEKTKKREDISEHEKQRIIEEWSRTCKEKSKRYLDYLISKDGDLCTECYLHDKEEEKILSPPSDMERNAYSEFLEGYYVKIESFYSIAISTFSEGIYDYIWETPQGGVMLAYIRAYYIAKVCPEKFLEDISTGYIDSNFAWIHRQKGGYLTFEDSFKVFNLIIKYNKEFLDKNEKMIKSVISKNFKSLLGYMEGLKIYEQIGKKEDIETLKKWLEEIPKDSPRQEVINQDLYKEKNTVYKKTLEEFQLKVNALIDRLSKE